MIYAKNYKAVSKFVKVMPRTLRPLFPGHGLEIQPSITEVLSLYFRKYGIDIIGNSMATTVSWKTCP